MNMQPALPSGYEGANIIQSRPQTVLGGIEGRHEQIAEDLRNSIILEELENLSDGFLPQSDLERILPDNIVSRILEDALTGGNNNHESVKEQPIRRKILAILILIDATSYIANFIDSGVGDINLPLNSKPCHQVLEGLRPAQIDSFCRWQWVVLAPVIDFTSKEHQTYHPNIRMPFLKAPEWQQEGAHGQVFRISIHQDHQKWKSSSVSYLVTLADLILMIMFSLEQEPIECYAMKRFYPNSKDTFDKERAALSMFSPPERNHGNLIEMVFSYQIGRDRFMIFPWADCNLEEFWKENKSSPSQDGLSWLLRQCHGLAEGLLEVHWYDKKGNHGEKDVKSEMIGRHGDIKPKNILFFGSQSQGGRLVIADFTLMRFHAPNTDNTKAKDVMGFSATYRPPELGCQGDIRLSQKYDIWTLGCVFLEFITWQLVGYDAVHGDYFRGADGFDYVSFREVRLNDDDMRYRYRDDKFFNRDDKANYEPKAKVKDSVMHWIGFLKQHPNASPTLKAFLTFVYKRMMMISPNNRCSVNTVRKELEKIMNGCADADDTEIDHPKSFPPRFIAGEKNRSVVAPGLSDSVVAQSESYEDLDIFKKMDLPRNENSFRPKLREEGHFMSPKAPLASGGMSEHHGQRNNQNPGGSSEEAQKGPNTRSNAPDGLSSNGKSRVMRKLGGAVSRLIPTRTRGRFLALWNRTKKTD